jgi:hypothetical protein
VTDLQIDRIVNGIAMAALSISLAINLGALSVCLNIRWLRKAIEKASEKK